MQVEGEDADEEGTVNAKMAYAIINQEPKGHGNMFNIDRHTGKLYVKEPTLDREVSGRCIRLTMPSKKTLHFLLQSWALLKVAMSKIEPLPVSAGDLQKLKTQ